MKEDKTITDLGEKIDKAADSSSSKNPAKEIGGPSGPEPTRFGDWEKNGRCSDF
ncbi:MAG: DUF1674 domain-containing protein [Rhodospirillales bacterium]|jgi:hypothetical protein